MALRILLDIGAEREKRSFVPADPHRGRPDVVLLLPVGGRERLQRLLVLEREDDERAVQIDLGPRKEHGDLAADLLELPRQRRRRTLASVGRNREVRALDLDPLIGRARGASGQHDERNQDERGHRPPQQCRHGASILGQLDAKRTPDFAKRRKRAVHEIYRTSGGQPGASMRRSTNGGACHGSQEDQEIRRSLAGGIGGQESLG
jgi:hypothetical protein